jgi:hypothetical protein
VIPDGGGRRAVMKLIADVTFLAPDIKTRQATPACAVPLTRVSPFRLSTMPWLSYQVRRDGTPKRPVSSAMRSSVNQTSAARDSPKGRRHRCPRHR